MYLAGVVACLDIGIKNESSGGKKSESAFSELITQAGGKT